MMAARACFPDRSSRASAGFAAAFLSIIMTACGGGGGGGIAGYALGGTMAGLAEGRQVLLLSGAGSQLLLKSNGNFRFAETLPDGARYTVTVAEQPVGQTCIVSRSSNAADTTGLKADALNLTVLCADNAYSLSGTVSGLPNRASVVLVDGNKSALTVAANGSFTMPVKVAGGAAYAITVQSQPAGATCTVNAGSGTVGTAAITNVAVACVPKPLNVSGTISGLAAGGSLALKLNDRTPLAVATNGTFSFQPALNYGDSLALTVSTQPVGQLCTVTNGTSSVITADVTDVQVSCSSLQYTLGGQVIGLSSVASTQALVLRNNAGDELSLTQSGLFRFAKPIAHGSSYSVTVGRQPSGQTCSISDGSGSAVSGPVSSVVVQCLAYVWRTSTVAGSGAASSTDGIGLQAAFNGPSGLSFDPWGRLVVADASGSRIRRVTVPQAVVSTVAGTPVPGFADAAVALNAAFQGPNGVAVDAQGNIYVADTLNHAIRRISALDGSVSTLAGNGQAGMVNGVGSAARFNAPRALVINRNGDLLVADSGNHAIRQVTLQGVVSTLAGVLGSRGSTDGPGAAALFNGPSGLALDAQGATLYVADTLNATIRAISVVGGNVVVSTVAGSGTAGNRDGSGTGAAFSSPSGLATDGAGVLYVADSGNHLIRQIQFVAGVGTVLTIAGSGKAGGVDGVGMDATFSTPVGLALSSSGNLYVTEAGGQRIRLLQRATN